MNIKTKREDVTAYHHLFAYLLTEYDVGGSVESGATMMTSPIFAKQSVPEFWAFRCFKTLRDM